MKSSSLAIAAALAFVPMWPAAAATFIPFDTGNDSELITSSPGDNVRRVVYSVDVGSLSVNDIVQVTTEAELTTHTDGNCRVTSQLIRGNSADAVVGTELDEATATNIFPAMDHIVVVKHAIHTVAGSTANHFVNLYVSSSCTLTVEQDYGRLQVLVIHNP